MSITVYGKPFCVNCDATQKLMKKTGVEYEYVDIAETPGALEYIKSLGFAQAPVVTVRDGETPREEWSGFRPDLIRSYAAVMAA